jgi:hypothetical protein
LTTIKNKRWHCPPLILANIGKEGVKMKCISSAEMKHILNTEIPFDRLELNKGIYEFHEKDDMSLCVSMEDIEEDEGVVINDVLIFNVFVGDEYINIEGAYRKDGNNFVRANEGEDNLIDMLVTTWNKFV